MARFMRTDLGLGHSRLLPPRVVSAAPNILAPIAGRLHPVAQTATIIRQRRAESALRAPTVVTAASVFIAEPTRINLAPRNAVHRRNNQRRVYSTLHPPVVIDLRPQVFSLRVELARNKTQPTHSRLAPPVVVTSSVVFAPTPTSVNLAPRNRQQVFRSFLRPPVAVDLRPQVFFLRVELARNKPQPTYPRLAPPTVVTDCIEETPAYSDSVAQGFPTTSSWSFTTPPTGVEGDIMLAWIVADVNTNTVTGSPTDWVSLGGPVDNTGTADVRGWLYYKISGPGEAGPYVWTFSGTQGGGITIWRGGPVDVTDPIDDSAVHGTAVGTTHTSNSITTTGSNRRVVCFAGADESATFTPYWSAWTNSAVEREDNELNNFTEHGVADYEKATPGSTSFSVTSADSDGGVVAIVALNPEPCVAAEPLARPIKVALAPQRRGIPHSRLFAPTVVTEGPVAVYSDKIHVQLVRRYTPTTSRRLAPPVVVFLAVELSGPEVTLVRRVPPPVRSVLGSPKVVFAPIRRLGGTLVQYVRRPTPPTTSLLRPPVVVGAAAAVVYGPEVTLAPSSRLGRRTRPTWVFPYVVQAGAEAFGFVAINLVRRYTPPTHSRLNAPVVVNAAVEAVVYAPKPHLVQIRPRAVRSFLRAPVVVFLAVELSGPEVTLVQRPTPPTTYRLTPPIVVFLAVEIYGPETTLVRRVTPPTHPRLAPPTVIDLRPQTYYLAISLTYSRRGRPLSHLSPPVVVGQAVEIYGPETTLVQRVTPPTYSRLGPPVVIDLRPQVYYLSVQLARIRPQPTTYFLRPPADTVGIEDQGRVKVTLAPSSRLARKATSRLQPPAVVAPVLFFGPQVTLAPSKRGLPRSRLIPPAVVQAADLVFYGPSTWLTYSRRGAPKSRLTPPTLIDLTPQVYYLGVSLTYSVRGRPVYQLAPPTVVFLAVEIYGPKTTFAPQPRKPRRARSFFQNPVLIGPGIFYRPVQIQLAYSRRGRPIWKLSPPTVIAQVEAYYGPSVTLAYSLRGKPKSTLKPPVVIDLSPQAYYLGITLAYSRRGRPLSHLSAPAVVDQAVEIYGPEIHLVRRYTPPVHSRLLPLVVIDLAVEIYGPEVHLVRRPTPPTLSLLRPPVVIDLRPQTYFLSVTLAPSRDVRHLPHSKLAPPAVVQPLGVRFDGPITTLTYSLRGRPKSILRKPVVIDLRPQTRFLSVNLAYSRRGQPKSFLLYPPRVVRLAIEIYGPEVWLTYSRRGRPITVLHAPTVVNPPERYYGPAIHLAPSKRGRPIFFLTPPQVVRHAVEIYGPETSLAYSRSGRPVYELKPPAVVAPVLFFGPSTTFAPQRRGAPKSFLREPTRVGVFIAQAIQVTLAPQSRGKTKSFLKPPVVVEAFAARPLSVTFARITPAPTIARLQPPTVVNTPQPVLYPITVTLAYSLRGKPVYFFTGIVITEFVPDEGEVCGDDEAGTEVCGFDEYVNEICGDDEEGSTVEGMSSAGSTIETSDSPDGTVCGSDEQNT